MAILLKILFRIKIHLIYIMKAIDRYGRISTLKAIKEHTVVKNNLFKILRGYGEMFKVVFGTIDYLRKINTKNRAMI